MGVVSSLSIIIFKPTKQAVTSHKSWHNGFDFKLPDPKIDTGLLCWPWDLTILNKPEDPKANTWEVIK